MKVMKGMKVMRSIRDFMLMTWRKESRRQHCECGGMGGVSEGSVLRQLSSSSSSSFAATLSLRDTLFLVHQGTPCFVSIRGHYFGSLYGHRVWYLSGDTVYYYSPGASLSCLFGDIVFRVSLGTTCCAPLQTLGMVFPDVSGPSAWWAGPWRLDPWG